MTLEEQDSSSLGSPLLEPAFEKFPHDWQHRDNDNTQNDYLDVLPDKRKISKEIAGAHEESHPQNGARNIIDDELSIVHSADPGDKRGERPNNWYETRQDDCSSTVFLVERMGFHQVFPFEQAAILKMEHSWPDPFPNPIVYRVAEDCCDEQNRHNDLR